MISSYAIYTHAHTRFEKSRKARHYKYIASGLGYCVVTKCKSKLQLRAKTERLFTKQTISVPSETFAKRDKAFLRKDRSPVNMALVSRDLFRNWWQDMDLYHRELEDHFRRLSTRGDLWQPPPIPSFNECFRPWKNVIEQLQHQVEGSTTVEREQDKYQVIVDMQHFAPEEITVRTDDKYITIEAKHEEKKDQHGYVSRHFVRRYTLPQGYDMGHVRPSLSCDGVLTVTAPRLVLPAPGERIVPIERVNVPAIKTV